MTAGVLVLVGAPLAHGAAADEDRAADSGGLSPRARAALTAADAVWCDDVDRTARTLEAAGIGPLPLEALDDGAEPAITQVLERLGRDERVVLVTGADAGTPGAGTPGGSGPGPAGERMVAAVASAGHAVEVVPGPSATMAALVVSGLDTGRFVVEDRLPGERHTRRERLAAIGAEQRTTVLHETVDGFAGTIADLVAVCGPTRRVVLAPGDASPHRSVWRGTLAEAAGRDGSVGAEVSVPVADGEPHAPGLSAVGGAEPEGGGSAARSLTGGAVVIVIDGASALAPPGDDEIAAAVRAELAAGSSTRDAARSVAARLDVPRRRAYEIATAAATSVHPPR